MAQINIVKIDLCGSKKFASTHEAENPAVRKAALETLLKIGKVSFPAADAKYPKGSFYKADGDAVYYLIDKPSVALRGAIEFMQNWFHEAMPSYPECRVFIDRGHIENVSAPGGNELVGRPFESISVFEKGVDDGRIYLSQAVLDSCDQTMAKFVYYRTYNLPSGASFKVYYIDFNDPRTVEDTSLIHAKRIKLDFRAADITMYTAHPPCVEGVGPAVSAGLFSLHASHTFFAGSSGCAVGQHGMK